MSFEPRSELVRDFGECRDNERVSRVRSGKGRENANSRTSREGVDEKLLRKVLSNPEMATILMSLAKSLKIE